MTKWNPQIADIITSILEMALLRIRAAAWAGDARRCAVEADHIHNLPVALRHRSLEMLQNYWDVERPAFLEQCGSEEQTGFEEWWDRLSQFTEATATVP